MLCSHRTTQRRISQMSAEIAFTMQNDLKSSLAFSIAFDESTDIQDYPQLIIFVRYVSSDLTIKEKLLDLVAIREITRGIDIKNALDEALKRFHVLVSVATDGAPAMVRKRVGLIGFMNSDPNFPEFLSIHCIIHREHLAANHFRYEHVIKTVFEIVNCIRVNGKNHRQFHNFVEELELEDRPSVVYLYCVVIKLYFHQLLSL